MGSLVFQAWDEDDLNGTPIGTLTTPSEKSILMELYGVGAGEFNISRHSDEVEDCRPGRYITVHLDADSNPARFGFFVTESQNVVLSENEEGAEVFHRSGEGAMSVLTDAIVWYKAVTDRDSAVPTGDNEYWQWTAAMGAHPAGVMVRMLEEAQERGCFPFLTYDFDRDEDSDGNPWTVDLEDFRLDIGMDLLAVADKLTKLGLVFVMDPDFTLHCYESEPTRRGAPSFGTDLSGSITFAAAVNIATAANQSAYASPAKSTVLVRGTRGDNGLTAWVEANSAAGLAEVKRRKEGLLDLGDATGFAQLQTAGLESIYSKLRLRDGASYLGVYDTSNVPFTDYNLGDTVEVDVPGVWDEEQRVIHSLGFVDTEAGEYDVIVGFDQTPGYTSKGGSGITTPTRPARPLPPGSDADMGDRAEDSTALMLSAGSGSGGGFVQSASTSTGAGAASLTATLAAPPTAGNQLVCVVSSSPGFDPMTPDDARWTLIATEYPDWASAGVMQVFTRVAESGDDEDTDLSNGGGATRVTVTVHEFEGAYVSHAYLETPHPDTTPDIPSVTPTASATVVLFIAQVVGHAQTLSTGPTSYTLTENVVGNSGGASHRQVGWYREIASASGSYDGGGTTTYAAVVGAGTVHMIIGVAVPTWSIAAPNVVDGDDATYETVTSNTDLVRLDLGTAVRAVRTRIRIAATNAGARTFTIKGANASDFSDEVTLTTIAFTATGSLTAQDVTGLWLTNESYRYFELSIGTSDTYRVHAWELYEETPGSSIVTDPTDGDAAAPLQDVLDNIEDQITAHEADSADAHDASAVSIADAGGYYTGTDVEAALQEIGVALATSSSAPPSILLESGSSVPFAFDEILQESDGSDFLWASE